MFWKTSSGVWSLNGGTPVRNSNIQIPRAHQSTAVPAHESNSIAANAPQHKISISLSCSFFFCSQTGSIHVLSFVFRSDCHLIIIALVYWITMDIVLLQMKLFRSWSYYIIHGKSKHTFCIVIFQGHFELWVVSCQSVNLLTHFHSNQNVNTTGCTYSCLLLTNALH